MVGGWVRDALLGRDCRDFDIEIYHLGQEALLEVLSRHGRPNLVGKAFGVIHLAMKGLHLDFSFPRTENKVGSGHRGFVVETHPDLSFTEAALRRDFTVNAMGMELPSLVLVDPYQGEQDLRAGILRHVGPAFVEDSLRVLRGVQFAARFHLTGAADTVALCRTLSLHDLSRERIGEEFRKWILKGDRPSAGLRFFVDVGLPAMFPAIAPWQSSWEKLGAVLDGLVPYREELEPAPAMRLMLAGLLCASPTAVRSFLENWIPENDLLQGVSPLLEEALALHVAVPGELSTNAPRLRRSALRTGGLQLSAALASVLAQTEGPSANELFATLKRSALELGVWTQPPQPYLSGRALLGMGLKPGKILGELIKECFELQLDGNIVNEPMAIDWARNVIQERGLL